MSEVTELCSVLIPQEMYTRTHMKFNLQNFKQNMKNDVKKNSPAVRIHVRKNVAYIPCYIF